MLKKKLNCVLLIDDDEATNYLHKMIIKNANCTEKCLVVESGYEALELLTSKENDKYLQPDLIFLDINMPKMNGWEFLEAYENLNLNQRGKMILVMLTTSMNPDDRKKAETIENLDGFISKPLTVEAINDLIAKYLD
jgi:CheY-like chemotaxis protein